MAISSALPLQRYNLSHLLLQHCLPLGWLALLSGLFWIGERSRYHNLYYLTLAAPTLLILLLQPRWLQRLRRNTLIRLFLLFTAYMLLSSCWAASSGSPLLVFKRPLCVALVLAAVVLLGHYPARLARATEQAARFAVLCALVSMAIFLLRGDSERLPGYGALHNPLLTGHVFGFFCVYWLCRWHQQSAAWHGSTLVLAMLWTLLLMTGSRGSLLAVGASLAWLALLQWRRQICGLLAVAVLMLLLYQLLQSSDGLLERGLSYRPAIWAEVLHKLAGHLFLGLGLGTPQVVLVASLPGTLADPHNMLLGVLFAGGLLGLGLWLAMYTYALAYAWRHRQCPAVLHASALVVFGLAASLTEGSMVFLRPNEHWFLLWIPLGLLAATEIQTKSAAINSPHSACQDDTCRS